MVSTLLHSVHYPRQRCVGVVVIIEHPAPIIFKRLVNDIESYATLLLEVGSIGWFALTPVPPE